MSARSVVMEGSLDEFDLVSVVQTVSIGRQSTSVELRDEHGRVVGTVMLKAGQIVSAHAEGASGVEALRRLLQTPRSRRFYVYRAPGVELLERIGPVTQVLSKLLSQPARPASDPPPMLMQGSLAQYDLRIVAEAVSLGRQAVGIEVFAPDGRRVGALYLKGGQILFAAWGRSAGEAALRELFKPRKSGRFVVFRAPQARIGDPIARLSDVVYPKRKGDSVEVVLADERREEDGDETQVTRVSQPPVPPPPAASARPAQRSPSAPPPPRLALSAPPARSSAPPARPSAPPVPAAARAPAPPVSRAQPAVTPHAPEPPTLIPATPASTPGQRDSVSEQPTAIPRSAHAIPAAALRPEAAPVPPSEPAKRSFPPPEREARSSPGTVPPPSEAPAAPRFRHSEAPAAAVPAEPAPLLLDAPRASPAQPRTTPIVAITSAKGGCGRTTIALNLAVTLARRGKRVVVVDADQGGVLLALHGSSARSGVADVLAGRASLDGALLSTRMSGLKLLPSGHLDPALFAHAGWKPLLQTLASSADFVLVDCAPGLYGATPSVLSSVSHRLQVVAAEPSAARVCAAHAGLLGKLPAPVAPSLGIVLNMLDYQVRASVRGLEELCAGEHAREVLDVTIPRSPAFLEASARGLPIVHAEQGASSTIAWVFETLASALLERLHIEAPAFAEPLLV